MNYPNNFQDSTNTNLQKPINKKPSGKNSDGMTAEMRFEQQKLLLETKLRKDAEEKKKKAEEDKKKAEEEKKKVMEEKKKAEEEKKKAMEEKKKKLDEEKKNKINQEKLKNIKQEDQNRIEIPKENKITTKTKIANNKPIEVVESPKQIEKPVPLTRVMLELGDHIRKYEQEKKLLKKEKDATNLQVRYQILSQICGWDQKPSQQSESPTESKNDLVVSDVTEQDTQNDEEVNTIKDSRVVQPFYQKKLSSDNDSNLNILNEQVKVSQPMYQNNFSMEDNESNINVSTEQIKASQGLYQNKISIENESKLNILNEQNENPQTFHPNKFTTDNESNLNDSNEGMTLSQPFYQNRIQIDNKSNLNVSNEQINVYQQFHYNKPIIDNESNLGVSKEQIKVSQQFNDTKTSIGNESRLSISKEQIKVSQQFYDNKPFTGNESRLSVSKEQIKVSQQFNQDKFPIENKSNLSVSNTQMNNIETFNQNRLPIDNKSNLSASNAQMKNSEAFYQNKVPMENKSNLSTLNTQMKNSEPFYQNKVPMENKSNLSALNTQMKNSEPFYQNKIPIENKSNLNASNAQMKNSEAFSQNRLPVENKSNLSSSHTQMKNSEAFSQNRLPTDNEYKLNSANEQSTNEETSIKNSQYAPNGNETHIERIISENDEIMRFSHYQANKLSQLKELDSQIEYFTTGKFGSMLSKASSDTQKNLLLENNSEKDLNNTNRQNDWQNSKSNYFTIHSKLKENVSITLPNDKVESEKNKHTKHSAYKSKIPTEYFDIDEYYENQEDTKEMEQDLEYFNNMEQPDYRYDTQVQNDEAPDDTYNSNGGGIEHNEDYDQPNDDDDQNEMHVDPIKQNESPTLPNITQRKDINNSGNDSQIHDEPSLNTSNNQGFNDRARKAWGKKSMIENDSEDNKVDNKVKPPNENPENDKHSKLLVFDNFEDEEDRARKMKFFEKKIKKMQANIEKVNERKREKSLGRPLDNIENIPTSENLQKPSVSKRSGSAFPSVSIEHNTSDRERDRFDRQIPEKPIQNLPPIDRSVDRKSRKSFVTSPTRNQKEEKIEESTNSLITPKITGSTPKNSGNTPITDNKSNKAAKNFSKTSNIQLIKNAIQNVCLAGEPNRKQREALLGKIDEVKKDLNMIILFKGLTGRQDFRALYTFDPNTFEVRRILAFSNSPATLDPSMIHSYYRYDSGAKEFKLIPSNKSFSLAIDAVCAHPNILKNQGGSNYGLQKII